MTDETPDQTADEIETATPAPEEVVPAPEPDPEPEIVPDGDIPPWGKELQAAVDEIREILEPVDNATPDPEIPGDGEPVADESPVRVPWTHRKLSWFGGGN